MEFIIYSLSLYRPHDTLSCPKFQIVIPEESNEGGMRIIGGPVDTGLGIAEAAVQRKLSCCLGLKLDTWRKIDDSIIAINLKVEVKRS